MFTIGVDQPLSNRVLYEYRCLENTKKLYNSVSKCDDKQQYKAIIETNVVSTTEVITDNRHISLSTSISVKKPRTRKSLCQFSELLDGKLKTAVSKLGAAK